MPAQHWRDNEREYCPLDPQSAKQAIEVLSREAGLDPKVSAHAFDMAAVMSYTFPQFEMMDLEELNEFDEKFREFLKEEAVGEVAPATLLCFLWGHLDQILQDMKKENKEIDPMFA